MRKKSSGLKILSSIIRYSWHASAFTFAALIVVSLLMSCLGFLELVSVEGLFDSAVEIANGKAVEYIYRPLLFLLAVLILNPFIDWLEYLVRGYFWRRGSGYMKFLQHEKTGRMKAVEFESTGNMDEMQKATLGSEDAPAGLRVMIQIIFLYIPYLAVLLIYLISVNRLLFLTILLIFIPTLILEVIKMRSNFDFEDRIANRRRKTKYFESCMISREYSKETKLNGAFEFFFGLFNRSNKLFGREFVALKKNLFIKALLMNLLNVAGFISVLLLLIYLVYTGAISIGLFAAVYYSISKITDMLKRLIDDIGEAFVGIANTSFLIQMLNTGTEEGRRDEIGKKCEIHIQDVSFSYPDSERKVLDKINLDIEEGSSLAIVGENGSGKSTLTKIIMGMYNPVSGKVIYGNKNMAPYSDESRFSQISAVFQNFTKYKLSVEDNIRMSDMQSEEGVETALEKADFELKDRELSADTILSREYNGQDLSGGEWQRIAIARGIYRKHDLIVLDEPTSAIDPVEEVNIFKMFEEITSDKTCIFVTHRLGSTRMADKIIVLDKGRIVEEGNHDTLMSNRGKYYNMFMAQAQWYKR